MTEAGKRIKKIIKYFDLNKNSFSKEIGMSSNVTIGRILNEERNPHTSTLKKIVKRFPQINYNWLRSGEGDMLKKGNLEQPELLYSINQKGEGVPYYDIDFIGGFDLIENDQSLNPTCYIDFPHYSKADYWVNVTGRSMEPLINHGDLIAIRKLNDWKTYILMGEVYGIVTDEYRTIKRIRISNKGSEFLRLVPANDEYDEQDIPISIVRAVFQILGCAKRIF